MKQAKFFAAGLGLALAACGGGEPSTIQPGSVRFDTIDGVVHVRNDGRGHWLPEDEWVVRTIRQTGSLKNSAEESLASAVVSTIPYRAGHTLVLDYVASRVLEFDEAGRLFRNLGRRGEGPGEFRAPTGMAVDHEGVVWVADAFGPRYTAFFPDGSLKGIYRRPIRATTARQQQLHVGSGGEIVDVGVVSKGGAGQALMFTRTRPADESVDTAWVVDMPSRGSVGSRPVPPQSAFSQVVRHYLQKLVWTLGIDGSLWVAPTGGAQLVNLSADGDTLRVIHVSHRPRPLTNDEEDLVAAAARETGLARSAFDVVPGVVQFLRVTADGHLLVFVKADPVGSASLMEVYDPEGRYLGVVELGFDVPRLGVAGLRGDTLVAPTVGPLDATFVIRAVIDRQSG